MTRYRLSTQAQADLDAIYDYVVAANEPAAERLLATFKEKFRRLGTRPLLGQLRSDLAPDLRCVTAGRYVIFYRLQTPGIEIVRVIHGARNVEAQFESFEDENPELPE